MSDCILFISAFVEIEITCPVFIGSINFVSINHDFPIRFFLTISGIGIHKYFGVHINLTDYGSDRIA
jgi:hypothetical protein